MSTDPASVLELVELYASVCVREEHFRRETVLGVTAAYPTHAALLVERDRLHTQIVATIAELSRD
jgi:hypothetical protein